MSLLKTLSVLFIMNNSIQQKAAKAVNKALLPDITNDRMLDFQLLE